MAMDIGAFDKPWLAWPLVGCHWLIIEWHAKVIDTLVAGRIVVRFAEKALESRTDPAFLLHMVGRERRDPFLSVTAVIFIIGTGDNLRPLIIILNVLRRRNVKVAQVSYTLQT